MPMHIDNVTMNADGSMTLTLTEFFNQAIAATFAGATVSGSAAAPGGGAITLTVNVTPGAPVVQQSSQSDPGGSAVIDG